jgi:hypothetical protein
MSIATEQPAAGPAGPTSAPAGTGSLFRAEVHRFRSRRFIHVLLGVAMAIWVFATVIGLLNVGTPTPDDYAAAQAQLEQMVAEAERGRELCLENPGPIPEDVSVEEWCGPEVTEANFGGVDSFLAEAPFDFGGAGTNGALGVAALSAALAFIVGATWIGAEWSTRSIVALLFWVPRRLTVMGVKIAVLVVAAAVFGVLTQAAWLATAGILDAVAGTGEAQPDGFWSTLLQTQARAVLLTVFAALLGFGLTNLVRNTGAALGIAFVYVVVVENATRIFRPHWDPFLLSTNAVGLVQDGGYTLQIWDQSSISADGSIVPVEYYLGPLQSAVFLGAVATVIVCIGVLLFTRRDVH